MKVLVVADRALIREALRGVLKELRGDITVLEAVDSRQAMEIVAEHADLDLILLDLNLLDRDGFSVLSKLRESTRRFQSWSCRPSRITTAWSRRSTRARVASFRNRPHARSC